MHKFTDSGPKEVPWLFNLAVKETARGRKVGEGLAKSIISEAERRGHQSIRLHVREDNVTARRLYEKLGMKEIGQFDEIDPVSGRPSKVLKMELRLPRPTETGTKAG